MDILNLIITGMNKEQVRYFKMFISGSSKTRSRKDAILFDFIRKSGEDYEEDKIHKRLYGRDNKNSFYRLKHRLMQDVNKSLMVQHFDDDEQVHVLHILALYKFHFNRNNIKVAYYFLRRAESEAKKIDNPELLDIIYSEFIRLSHDMVTVDPQEYIRQRNENQEQIKNLRTIDDILAVVSYKMKITQNFSENENPVIPLLQKTLKEYSGDKDLQKSPKLRFKIYHAVSQILLQKRSYKALQNYLLNIYKEFEKEKLFNKSNHDTKLQMLVFIINTLFKNNKLNESLEYAAKLKSAMGEYQKMFYDKYLFFHYNSLVINYSKLDKEKAIEILNEMKENEKIRSTPFYEMFVYLNLAVTFFDKKDFHQSIRNLNKIYLLDGYKTADRSLQFKIGIAELIIRYELNDEDVLEYKIKQVKKDFKEFFSKKENLREKEMVAIIHRMMETENLKRDRKSQSMLQAILKENNERDSSDSEIINYKNWLTTKMI